MMKWTIPMAFAVALAGCGTMGGMGDDTEVGGTASSGVSATPTGPAATGTTAAGTDLGSVPAGGTTAAEPIRDDPLTGPRNDAQERDVLGGGTSGGAMENDETGFQAGGQARTQGLGATTGQSGGAAIGTQ